MKVTVHGPKGSEAVDMLAGTGASHTVISPEVAMRLGIEPVGEAVAEFADGSERPVKFGRAEVQIQSERWWGGCS